MIVFIDKIVIDTIKNNLDVNKFDVVLIISGFLISF